MRSHPAPGPAGPARAPLKRLLTRGLTSSLTRGLTAAGLAAAAFAGTGLPAAGGPASADTGGPARSGPAGPGAAGYGGSAFGLAATGPIDLPPVPAVASGGERSRKTLLHEEHTRLVSASMLDVLASPADARSAVARLAVPTARLLADAVSATCHDGRGSAHLVNAVLGGRRLVSAPPPNTTLPVDVDGAGRSALILNKQRRTSDGRLAVTALELALPFGEGATIKVASATCGRPAAAAAAPAPVPVKHQDLPVTG